MTNSQHIVLLGPAYPYRGGIASFTERLAREFEYQGHRCTLVTFSLQYPGVLFPGKTQYAEGVASPKLTIRRWVNTINPISWIKTGIAIRKLNPDMIIVRYWMPFFAPAFGTILRIAGFKKRTRIICIADNIIPHEKRPGDTLLTSYFNGAVEAYLVMSEQVKCDLEKLGIRKETVLLPHPLFDHFGDKADRLVAREALKLDPQQGILLFFGFIRHYKGVDLLLEAMTDPRIKALGYQLIIAGEFYEDEKPYRQYIQDHDLEGTVRIDNQFIPESHIAWYFSAADVLVQPYRHATQSGVTPLAMHFDLPMIVTDAGGLKEMVADGVTGLVVGQQPASIAEGILQYFALGKDHFSQNIPAYKGLYSWNRLATALLEICQVNAAPKAK